MRSIFLKTTLGVMVIGTVLVIARIALGGGGEEPPHGPVNADPIVGTWNCVVPADSSPCVAPDCFNVIKNFQAGGTITEMDNLAAPSQESVVLGSWTREKPDKRTYSAELEQFDFAGGSFQGTFHYATPITLDRSLNKLTGSFHATEVDPLGNVTDLGSGTFSCTRNTAP